jgi:hypothetical protein
MTFIGPSGSYRAATKPNIPTTPPIPATNAGAPALLIVLVGLVVAPLPPARVVFVLVKLVVLAVTVVVLEYLVEEEDSPLDVVMFPGMAVEETLWAAVAEYEEQSARPTVRACWRSVALQAPVRQGPTAAAERPHWQGMSEGAQPAAEMADRRQDVCEGGG